MRIVGLSHMLGLVAIADTAPVKFRSGRGRKVCYSRPSLAICDLGVQRSEIALRGLYYSAVSLFIDECPSQRY